MVLLKPHKIITISILSIHLNSHSVEVYVLLGGNLCGVASIIIISMYCTLPWKVIMAVVTRKSFLVPFRERDEEGR